MRFKFAATACLLMWAATHLSAQDKGKIRSPSKTHVTFLELVGYKPEDVKINISKWSDFASFRSRTDYGAKEVEEVRRCLSEYVVVADAEKKSMLVSLVAMSPREGTFTFPDGHSARWTLSNFLTVKFTSRGDVKTERVFNLAPRSWLETIRPKG